VIVTDRMVAAALLAEAHVPDGVDMLTRQKLVMRSSITAALAVMPIKGETEDQKLAREIGERVLALIRLNPRLIAGDAADDTRGGES
jgi:hypothetical protein